MRAIGHVRAAVPCDVAFVTKSWFAVQLRVAVGPDAGRV